MRSGSTDEVTNQVSRSSGCWLVWCSTARCQIRRRRTAA